jgi:hypothetical protein
MNIDKLKLEQYKLLISQLQNVQLSRESSNNFWIVINTIGLTAITYIHDIQSGIDKKTMSLIWGLLILGSFLGILWLRALISIKKDMEIIYKLIAKSEKELGSTVFSHRYKEETTEVEEKYSVVISEIFVPVIFILSYVVLGILFYWVF